MIILGTRALTLTHNSLIQFSRKTIMGNSGAKPETVSVPDAPQSPPGEKPKCKACCACPETKKARDEWYVYQIQI